MARSVWKGIFLSKQVYISMFNLFFFKHKRWTITSRGSVITRPLIHTICGIHNGLSCKQLWVRKNYVGYKFGTFAFTRKNYHYIPKEKKSKLRR